MQSIQFGGIYRLNFIDETPRRVSDEEVEELQNMPEKSYQGQSVGDFKHPDDMEWIRAIMLRIQAERAQENALYQLDDMANKMMVVKFWGENLLIRDDENGNHFSQLLQPFHELRNQFARKLGLDPQEMPLDFNSRDALAKDADHLYETRLSALTSGKRPKSRAGRKIQETLRGLRDLYSRQIEDANTRYSDDEDDMIQEAIKTGTLKEMDVVFDETSEKREEPPIVDELERFFSGRPAYYRPVRVKSLNIQG
jgi:hypothetical protein